MRALILLALLTGCAASPKRVEKQGVSITITPVYAQPTLK